MAVSDLYKERDRLYDDMLEALGPAVDEWIQRVVEGAPTDPEDYADVDTMVLLLMGAGLAEMVRELPYAQIADVGRRIATATGHPDAPDYDIAAAGQPSGIPSKYIEGRARDIASSLRTRVQESALLTNPTAQEVRGMIRQVLANARIAQHFETALAVWDRSVQVVLGQQARTTLYAYMGPLDRLNRPFCRDIMERREAYTPAQVNDLNNHPLLHSYVPPNVLAMCGGYGCRHIFVPISVGFAKDNGYAVNQG